MSTDEAGPWITDPPIRRALLSVSDKQGLIELGRALCTMGIELLSTGGSALLLREANVEVTELSAFTGFPEILGGRVKSLHPRVHAGLLAQREREAHLRTLEEHDIPTIDLLVVNLYPFESITAQNACSLEEAMEHIDIGGPAMVRAAAKNWRSVAALTDPAQYTTALNTMNARRRLREDGAPSLPARARFRFAVAAFERISAYDAAISNYLGSIRLPDPIDEPQLATAFCSGRPQRSAFPLQRTVCYTKVQDLRYGENPHQRAALYRDRLPTPGSLITARQLQGKELSFNNLADADAAWSCAGSFERASCVIVKHANPCGVASGRDPLDAYRKAFACDPTSAFGGVIALNVALDASTAEALSKQFVEVLVAPGYSPEALAVLRAKAAVRVLHIPCAHADAGSSSGAPEPHDLKRIGSGLLVQDADHDDLQGLRSSLSQDADHDDLQGSRSSLSQDAESGRRSSARLRCVTRRQPSEAQLVDLLFAWRVARFLKSNAIVFARGEQTLGLGAGQMSRLDAARIATFKAQAAGLALEGSVAASDAFFPFRDGLDVLADAGACAVIQPGGSKRDAEVIDAADARGLAMVFTGVRHFRH
ncbi:MAG: bifunctional phosphoribosylaminoimidazolecarboxamide formyltransferase/IMP cyclohydrolase [Betaproteobacteria bacterium]|nr:bifunctional phosphoribosylaminoimidazolecarboxamide formyltransferase/IMP cyclohydrolase [Betaproteobacteria bacterium]